MRNEQVPPPSRHDSRHVVQSISFSSRGIAGNRSHFTMLAEIIQFYSQMSFSSSLEIYVADDKFSLQNVHSTASYDEIK